MKKFIVLFTLLCALGAPTAYAAPAAAPLCGRVVWRVDPASRRSDYHYDVIVGKKLLHWTAPFKVNIGARLCV